MFTAFATKILIAILKKATALSGFEIIARGFNIVSWFQMAHSIHECTELPDCVIEVPYTNLTDQAADELVKRVVDNQYNVQQRETGVYVASVKPILQPKIAYPDLEAWRHAGFSEAFAIEWAEKNSNFRKALERKRHSFQSLLNCKRLN